MKGDCVDFYLWSVGKRRAPLDSDFESYVRERMVYENSQRT